MSKADALAAYYGTGGARADDVGKEASRGKKDKKDRDRKRQRPEMKVLAGGGGLKLRDEEDFADQL